MISTFGIREEISAYRSLIVRPFSFDESISRRQAIHHYYSPCSHPFHRVFNRLDLMAVLDCSPRTLLTSADHGANDEAPHGVLPPAAVGWRWQKWLEATEICSQLIWSLGVSDWSEDRYARSQTQTHHWNLFLHSLISSYYQYKRISFPHNIYFHIR